MSQQEARSRISMHHHLLFPWGQCFEPLPHQRSTFIGSPALSIAFDGCHHSIEHVLITEWLRYRHLFEQMPIAMWQVDGRGLADLLNGLRAAGVTDLGTYLDHEPDFLLRMMDALLVEEVNEHAIKMFGATERSQLLGL